MKKFNELKDPLYYNLSQIKSYTNNNTRTVSPAVIEENNYQLILEDSSNYYISIARATIPSNSIPMIIIPVTTGQPNPDLTLYFMQMKLATGPYTYDETKTQTLNVNFLSQLPFLQSSIKPPLNTQDFSNDYYFIYDIEQMLLMFNNTLSSLWNVFAVGVGAIAGFKPYMTFDYGTRIFSINMPASVGATPYFDQNSAYPHYALFMDDLSLDLFGFTGYDIDLSNETLIACFNKYDNNSTVVIGPDTSIYYKMTSSQSSINMWQALNKIVIATTYGISTAQEYETIPSARQQSTDSNLLNKPQIQMLTDLEVDRSLFAENRNYIQFLSSSITQQRLISVKSDYLQSFILSVYWVDNFGVQRPLRLPSGIPLSIKLGFYPKSTTLI